MEDILDLNGPVAFVVDQPKQLHQAVCPWCAKDIGKPRHLQPDTTVGKLYSWLLTVQIAHMNEPSCPCGGATEMAVETEDRRRLKQ